MNKLENISKIDFLKTIITNPIKRLIEMKRKRIFKKVNKKSQVSQ
jgi:hypothetical protein